VKVAWDFIKVGLPDKTLCKQKARRLFGKVPLLDNRTPEEEIISETF